MYRLLAAKMVTGYEWRRGYSECLCHSLTREGSDPRSKQAFFPNRALGVKSIRIKPVEHLHEITLSAPKENRVPTTVER